MFKKMISNQLFSLASRVLFLLFAVYTSPIKAATYDLSYTFDNGINVSGTLSGIASSNGVTVDDLFSLTVDGIKFDNMYSSSWNGTKFSTTNGFVSFSGANNNFIFIDADFPVSETFTWYLMDIPPYHEIQIGVGAHFDSRDFGVDESRWSLTARSVPEPSVVALIGLGLLGILRSKHRADS